MRKLLLNGLVFAVLAVAGAAFAYPTLTGPTGFVLQPSTQVVPTGSFTAAIDILISKDLNTGITDAEPVRLLYGLFPGTELGATWIPQGDINTWNVNAKYRFPGEWEKFRLAIGADGGSIITDNGNGGTNSNGIYDVTLVTSYPLLEKLLIADLGVTVSGRPIVEGANTNTISGVDGYLGLDAMLPADFSIAFDMSTQSRALEQRTMPLGVALRYAPSSIDGLTLQVGCANLGDVDNRYNFLAGLAYRFGG
jgi:hypothetical protein